MHQTISISPKKGEHGESRSVSYLCKKLLALAELPMWEFLAEQENIKTCCEYFKDQENKE